MATGAEMSGNIINEQLSAGKYGTDRTEQIIKRDWYPEK